MASKTDPNYGNGLVEIEDDDEILIDESALTERLLATFRATGYRPPTLPSVATELLEMSRRADVEFRDIVALLETDAMLAGRVVQVAQSPLYAAGSKVPSVKNAVTRLGLRTIRDLVLEVAMNLRVFKCAAYAGTMEQLRLHSVATAHIAREICKYTTFDGDYAFLCGLLHDAGIAGTLIALAEGRAEKPPDLLAIWPAIDRMHAEAGAAMAELWELPAEVRMVVGAHQEVRIDGFDHPLAAAVAVADELARALGVGVLPGEEKADSRDAEVDGACLSSHTHIDRATPAVLKRAWDALQLTDAQRELIAGEAREVVEKLGG